MINEWSMKVSRTWSTISKRGTGLGPHRWLEGEVYTPHGIVSVYSQGHDGGRPSTSYRVVIGGRLYGRSERVARTRRGMAIVAGRWVRDLARTSEGDDRG